MTTTPLRIGTRSSPLALAQAEMVKAALVAAYGWADDAVQLVPMVASGDKVQDRPLAEIGGKALWTKETEAALIDGSVDICVHSMKDVETVRPDIFRLAAMLPRADVRDRIIGADSINSLRENARVGTSSPRRAAQLKAIRPDLRIASIRGNVGTRLAKVESGKFDATLLAAAGLDRLGMHGVGVAISIDEMLPAASQGAIGIDCLSSRDDIRELLGPINHQETFDCVMIERAFLEALGGTCHSPAAAHAFMLGGMIMLNGEILSEDGQERRYEEMRNVQPGSDAPAFLARTLLKQASAPLRALFAA
jgi:hydroxymethylbilane synthase